MSAGNRARHLTARELIDVVLDAGSFTSWDTPVPSPGPRVPDAYVQELERAREKSGEDESVLTGSGSIQGRRVAVIVSEFRFLAGSIGSATAARITSAVLRATEERLPLLAGPASGGTRMQEGTPAFLSMVDITGAVRAHREAGLPYLVYLRHPTTGGVMASWGSLGHVTVAEPQALLGFLGPRVYEALYGREFPADVQTAEHLFEMGLIDAVVPPEDLAGIVDTALAVLLAEPAGRPEAPPTASVRPASGTAWESILRSRDPRRPDLRRLLAHGARDVLPLNGTGQGEKDPGVLLALARFGEQPCIVLGHQRPRRPEEAGMGPASLREARRGMKLAEELGLPLLTVIDTAGADLSKEAEEGGLAGEIARSLYDLIGLAAPSVSVLLGQGSGGGALALLPADSTIAAEHAWLSPLPPEGASAIVHRTVDHAAQMAEAQDVKVAALVERGVVDHVVDERPDAAEENRAFSERMATAIEYELARVRELPAADRSARRSRKYRASLDQGQSASGCSDR